MSNDNDEAEVSALLDLTLSDICRKLDEDNKEEFAFKVDFEDVQLTVWITLRKHEAIQ
jgi:hypothetical protein